MSIPRLHCFHIINQLITTGEMKEINRHKKAFTLKTKTFNNPYTCRNIFSGKTLKAHLFIVSIYSMPSQTHKEIADELGLLLTPYVCGNPDFSSRAGKLFENFFHDLLRRRVQNQILIRQQISIFSWDIHDTYSVLVIDMKGQQQDRLQFVITYLCNLEDDCQAFEYDGYTVCIFHAVTADSKSRFSARVEKLLKNMSLKGAFSKNFTNICDVDIYYMQASNIIQFSRRNNVGRNLLFQEHVGLYGIVDASLERHDASELCHPDTIRLYEYDRQNGTEYLETLYQYLLHDRNAVQAAKVLYVHRNTMSYRLEKLREMLTFDMEDGDTRIFVLMSILLLKCQADKLEES